MIELTPDPQTTTEQVTGFRVDGPPLEAVFNVVLVPPDAQLGFSLTVRPGTHGPQLLVQLQVGAQLDWYNAIQAIGQASTRETLLCSLFYTGAPEQYDQPTDPQHAL